jgi:hypothetical protein
MGSRGKAAAATGCDGKVRRRLPAMAVGLLVASLVASQLVAVAANVTYDHKAIVINGRRRILISGSIHYPRSTPEVSMCLLWFDFSLLSPFSLEVFFF